MIPTTVSPIFAEEKHSPKDKDADSEDGMDDDEGINDDGNEEGDDAIKPKTLIGNYNPTQKENEKHMKTHLPFRPKPTTSRWA